MRPLISIAIVVASVVLWPPASGSLRGAATSDAAAAGAESAPLFDDAVLHRVDLWVNSRDWRHLVANFQSNDYYPATFRWNGQTVTNVAIRSRGAGSRSQVKPGLRVDFNRYVTGRRFLGLTALVLDNLTQDPSCVHETLAMRLYRQLGLPAPREAHAAVYLNNSFFGLYTMVEEVNEESVARLFGEAAGYLYEYRWTDEYRFEYLGPTLEPYAARFEARTRLTDTLSAQYGPLEQMVRTINEVSDEDFVAAVSAFLDLQAFVRHVAVQNYLAEWDGLLGYAGLNNFYLYRPAGGVLSRIIPWDEDTAFGPLEWGVLTGHDENVLMRRLMAIPEWQASYVAALLQCLDVVEATEEGAEGGWLEREARRQLNLVRATALADTRKPFTNEEFEAASASVIAFTRERGPIVRGFLAPWSQGSGHFSLDPDSGLQIRQWRRAARSQPRR